MTCKQTILFKTPKRELSSYRERKGIWINYIEESRIWKNRIKKLSREMLSTDQPKAKSAYMEQIRSAIRTSCTTAMRKMRSLHKQKDTGMDIQTR